MSIQISWAVGIAAFVCTGFCFWWARAYITPLLIVGSFLTGLGYGSAAFGDRTLYLAYLDQQITIAGRIKEDVGKTASGKVSVQIDEIFVQENSLPGTVFVTIARLPDAKRGDIITVTGTAREGFGSFPLSVGALSLDKVIHPTPGDVGRVVRDWFADMVRKSIPEPQASLGIGFLTGQKSALPETLAEALKIAGLTHIVVASGYNLTILVQMSRKLFVKTSKFVSAMASSTLIVMFMAVTGLSPSMTRAGLVSGMSLLSGYYGHTFNSFVLLPFAAAITVAIQPSYVWGDLGWQLSFSAFAAVMLVAPALQKYFFGEKEPGLLRQILGETIAAHIVTVPIIALSFGTMSNVAIVANLLVVPFVPLAMLLTFLCGIGGILNVPFLFIIAEPTSWLLQYMVSVASYVASLSWAQIKLDTAPWVWLVYSVALVLVCLWMHRASKREGV